MKTTYAVIVCVLLLLVSACSQKVNNPADVQAIKKSIDDYAKAINAGDANGVAALMTEKTVYADLYLPVAVGKEAIRSLTAAYNSQFKFDFSVPVEDVRVVGDLAVARGSWSLIRSFAASPGEHREAKRQLMLPIVQPPFNRGSPKE